MTTPDWRTLQKARIDLRVEPPMPNPPWPTDADVLAIVEQLTAPVPRATRRGKRGKSRGLTQPPQQGTLDGVQGETGDVDAE